MIIQNLSCQPIFKAESGGGKKVVMYLHRLSVVQLPSLKSYMLILGSQRLNQLQPPLWLPFARGREAELTLRPAPLVPRLGSRDSPGSSMSPTKDSVMGSTFKCVDFWSLVVENVLSLREWSVYSHHFPQLEGNVRSSRGRCRKI